MWNYFSEREFLESILNQRVNFAITVFALIIAAVAQIPKLHRASLLFLIGAILLTMLLFSVQRIHSRLKITLEILYKIDKRHVFPVTNKELYSYGFFRRMGRQTKVTYVWITLFAALVLWIGFFGSLWLLFTDKGKEVNDWLSKLP